MEIVLAVFHRGEAVSFEGVIFRVDDIRVDDTIVLQTTENCDRLMSIQTWVLRGFNFRVVDVRPDHITLKLIKQESPIDFDRSLARL